MDVHVGMGEVKKKKKKNHTHTEGDSMHFNKVFTPTEYREYSVTYYNER